MIFNPIIKLFHLLFKFRPIVKVAYLNEALEYVILLDKFKTKRYPIEGEIIYFNDIEPYYTVTKIMHDISIRHIIWIVVTPLNISDVNERLKNMTKNLTIRK